MKEIQLKPEMEVKELVGRVANYAEELGFKIKGMDDTKLWGAYLTLDETFLGQFLDRFIPELSLDRPGTLNPVTPKFLLIAPGKRLSWQVHSRRGELWKISRGRGGVYLSETDLMPDKFNHVLEGGIVQFDAKIRHSLVALENWVIVSELWLHNDPLNLSDEDDIRRIAVPAGL